MFRTITWREDKARLNLKEHRVSFNEAMTVFNDPLAFTEPDRKHSHGEERFTTVGQSTKNRLIRVTHLERDIVEYDVLNLHIISAREPENWEREIYEESL